MTTAWVAQWHQSECASSVGRVAKIACRRSNRGISRPLTCDQVGRASSLRTASDSRKVLLARWVSPPPCQPDDFGARELQRDGRTRQLQAWNASSGVRPCRGECQTRQSFHQSQAGPGAGMPLSCYHPRLFCVVLLRRLHLPIRFVLAHLLFLTVYSTFLTIIAQRALERVSFVARCLLRKVPTFEFRTEAGGRVSSKSDGRRLEVVVWCLSCSEVAHLRSKRPWSAHGPVTGLLAVEPLTLDDVVFEHAKTRSSRREELFWFVRSACAPVWCSFFVWARHSTFLCGWVAAPSCSIPVMKHGTAGLESPTDGRRMRSPQLLMAATGGCVMPAISRAFGSTGSVGIVQKPCMLKWKPTKG